MELKKTALNSNLPKEFINQLQSQFKEKIIRFISENENVFLIQEDEFYHGFLNLNFRANKISVKLFTQSVLNNNSIKQLISQIADLVQSKNSKYLTFLHLFDSINILDSIDGIDFMHQYEFNTNLNMFNQILAPKYNISTKINDYEKLIHFHELCYSDDKDYMVSDWRKMLQSFPEAPFPKLTYICSNETEIIGSIMGYIIPKKNKKYLYSICVHPNYRNKSIGEFLLNEFIQAEAAIPCYLTVYESAIPAVNLYKKFGFKKIKTVEVIVRNEV